MRSSSKGRLRVACLTALGLLTALISPVSAQKAPAIDSSESKALMEAMKLEPMGLESDLKKIEEQWDVLEQHIRDAEHIKIRAGKVSRWSVGQQVMHCAMVVDFLGGQLKTLLDNPDMGVNDELKPIREQMLQGGAIPRGRGQAPAPVAVHFQPSLEEIQAKVKEARANWDKIAKRKDEIAKSKAKYPHFAFGPMTPADWTRFTAIHTAHHLKIINDILAEHAKMNSGS